MESLREVIIMIEAYIDGVFSTFDVAMRLAMDHEWSDADIELALDEPRRVLAALKAWKA